MKHGSFILQVIIDVSVQGQITAIVEGCFGFVGGEMERVGESNRGERGREEERSRERERWREGESYIQVRHASLMLYRVQTTSH